MNHHETAMFKLSVKSLLYNEKRHQKQSYCDWHHKKLVDNWSNTEAVVTKCKVTVIP